MSLTMPMVCASRSGTVYHSLNLLECATTAGRRSGIEAQGGALKETLLRSLTLLMISIKEKTVKSSRMLMNTAMLFLVQLHVYEVSLQNSPNKAPWWCSLTTIDETLIEPSQGHQWITTPRSYFHHLGEFSLWVSLFENIYPNADSTPENTSRYYYLSEQCDADTSLFDHTR